MAHFTASSPTILKDLMKELSTCGSHVLLHLQSAGMTLKGVCMILAMYSGNFDLLSPCMKTHASFCETD